MAWNASLKIASLITLKALNKKIRSLLKLPYASMAQVARSRTATLIIRMAYNQLNAREALSASTKPRALGSMTQWGKL